MNNKQRLLNNLQVYQILDKWREDNPKNIIRDDNKKNNKGKRAIITSHNISKLL